MTDKLFTPLTLGPLTLRHRVVMAPLTRMRASPDGNVPTALNALYYDSRRDARRPADHRGDAGVWQGHGHPNVPGIHTAAQVEGWRRRDRCRARARRLIFLQLWHTGRVSHSSHQPDALSAGRAVGHRGAGATLDADVEAACLTSCRARWSWPRCRPWSTAGARLRRML